MNFGILRGPGLNPPWIPRVVKFWGCQKLCTDFLLGGTNTPYPTLFKGQPYLKFVLRVKRNSEWIESICHSFLFTVFSLLLLLFSFSSIFFQFLLSFLTPLSLILLSLLPLSFFISTELISWIIKKLGAEGMNTNKTNPVCLAQRVSDCWNMLYSGNAIPHTKHISIFNLFGFNVTGNESIGSGIHTNIIPLFGSIQLHFQLCNKVELFCHSEKPKKEL